MNLNMCEWKSFYLKDLYNIRMGDKLDKNKMSQDCPSVNFVSRISYNNGVDIKVDLIEGKQPNRAGLLTVSLGGEYLGSCYVQKEPFYTAQNVAIMEPRVSQMSFFVNLFICALVKFECQTKYYAFGRELNTHINTDFEINLPIARDNSRNPILDSTKQFSNEGYIPDWHFMDNFIKSLHHKPLTTSNKNKISFKLDLTKWRWFQLGKLFEIKKGKRLTSEDQTEGKTLYIGAIDSNNGVANHIGQQPIHDGNTISLSYNGSVGEAFYQAKAYWATDDVNALYSRYEGFNKHIGLFICSIIRQEKYRFNYGRKWTIDNMKISEICLPIKFSSNGKPYFDSSKKYSSEGFVPDWSFMENFIMALPYGDRL